CLSVCHHQLPHSFPTRRSSDLCSAAPESLRTRIYAAHPPAHSARACPHRTSVFDLTPYPSLPNIIFPAAPQPPLSGPYTTKEYEDRKSTRLNSSHVSISYAVFC